MKYSIVAVVAAMAASVSAQLPPACALSCVTDVSGSGCNVGDFACLCKSAPFIKKSTACICTSCTTPSDQAAAAAAAASICGALGVTVPTGSSVCASVSGGGSSSAPATTSAPAPTTSAAPATTSSAEPTTTEVSSSTSTSTTSTTVAVVTTTANNSTVAPPTPTTPVASASATGAANVLMGSGFLAAVGAVIAFAL